MCQRRAGRTKPPDAWRNGQLSYPMRRPPPPMCAEHFPAKWNPVCRKKMLLLKDPRILVAKPVPLLRNTRDLILGAFDVSSVFGHDHDARPGSDMRGHRRAHAVGEDSRLVG